MVGIDQAILIAITLDPPDKHCNTMCIKCCYICQQCREPSCVWRKMGVDNCGIFKTLFPEGWDKSLYDEG